MSIRSFIRRFWSTMVLVAVVVALSVLVIYSIKYYGAMQDISIIEVRAAVRGIEVTGGGVARIEVQLDSVVVRLEDIATLRARLDSCMGVK